MKTKEKYKKKDENKDIFIVGGIIVILFGLSQIVSSQTDTKQQFTVDIIVNG